MALSRKIGWRTALLGGMLAVLTFCAASTAGAQLVAFRIVGDSIPASLTGLKGDPARGRAIAAKEGMCLLCHSGPFPGPNSQGNLGPPLDSAGNRWSEGQLRLRIVDA